MEADEVRSLASKPSEASKNTSALIEGSLRAVENGAKIANETAQVLVAAVEGAKTVTSVVEEIAQASPQQEVPMELPLSMGVGKY